MDKADACALIEQNILKELDGIAKNGITTGNIEIAYKLIEMHYRLILIDKMNSSECNCDSEYKEAKKHYRSDRCQGSKEEVLKCLARKIQSIHSEVDALWKDADFAEEREIIEKFKGG